MYEYTIYTLEVNINITIRCLSRVNYDIIIYFASLDEMSNLFSYLLLVQYYKHRMRRKVVLGIGVALWMSIY